MPSSIWEDDPGKEVIKSSPAFPGISAHHCNGCTVNSKDLFTVPKCRISFISPGAVLTLRGTILSIGYYIDPNENRFSPVVID